MASARTEATRKKIREEIGILAAENNSEAAAFADVLILACEAGVYGGGHSGDHRGCKAGNHG